MRLTEFSVVLFVLSRVTAWVKFMMMQLLSVILLTPEKLNPLPDPFPTSDCPSHWKDTSEAVTVNAVPLHQSDPSRRESVAIVAPQVETGLRLWTRTVLFASLPSSVLFMTVTLMRLDRLTLDRFIVLFSMRDSVT